jgi:hypothetical protein
MNISPLGGRLMRAAICGLLAATVLPSIASADDAIVGSVTVTSPVTSTSVTTSVSTPSVPSVPTVFAGVSTPVTSATASVSTQRSVARIASGWSQVAPKAKKTLRKGKPVKRKKKSAGSAPTRSFMSAISTSAPFTGTFTNTCVFPAEDVLVNGVSKLTSITQADGSIAVTANIGGTGLAGDGILTPFVKYSFSDETRIWIFGPGTTDFAFYDYRKLSRSGDTGSMVGGDDFFIRFFFSIPLGSEGVPDFSALSTAMTGGCR